MIGGADFKALEMPLISARLALDHAEDAMNALRHGKNADGLSAARTEIAQARECFKALCRAVEADRLERDAALRRVCGGFAMRNASGETLTADDDLFAVMAAAARKSPLHRLAAVRAAATKTAEELAANAAVQKKLTNTMRNTKGAERNAAIKLRNVKRDAAAVKKEQSRHLVRQWLKGAAGLARTMHEEAKRMAAALADEQIEDCKRILRAEIAATARHFDDVKEVLNGIR